MTIDLSVVDSLMPKPSLLAAARLSPLLLPQLRPRTTCTIACTRPIRLPLLPSRRRCGRSPPAGIRGAPALIAQLPALEIISVMGVGYDGVDVAAAKARGVMVTHTPDVLNDDVADLAIGLMLCARASCRRPTATCAAATGQQGPDAAGAQDVRRAAGHRRHGTHRAGHRAAGGGLRHDIAYTARSAKPALPWLRSRRPRRWRRAATSWC
jgi:hydroxypyruvate reductase